MTNQVRTIYLLLCSACLLCFSSGGAADTKPATKTRNQTVEKAALGEFNALIGGWRGVGMPRRGSSRGAWIESADWVWDFKKGDTGLRYVVKNGKLLKSARLKFDPKTKQYQLHGEFADSVNRTYTGVLNKNVLTLTSQPDKSGASFRITITRLNEKRTLVLHERRPNRKGRFTRIAEVGYTRKGTSIAGAGAGGPECVVTGGKGTIQVSYQGKTYFVCCSGCKQAFDDDPAGILAEYRQRLAEKKKKQKSASSKSR